MSSFFKRPRWESRDYLDFVRGRSCMHCFAPPPSCAHHFHPTEKGVARKPDDCFTVPLCVGCHEYFHLTGTLPSHSAELTRTDFVREQWRCMALWICRDDGKEAANPF
jgi:hypothetical protein